MAVTQYIGSRYVPLFADPVEWSSTKSYESLTIVLHEGNSYTSKQFVPVGIEITNDDYWVCTGNYNAQVEQYRREVRDVSAALPLSDFTEETVSERLTSAISDVNQTMQQTVENVNKSLASTVEDVNQSLEDTLETVNESLAETTEEINQTTDNKIKISENEIKNYAECAQSYLGRYVPNTGYSVQGGTMIDDSIGLFAMPTSGAADNIVDVARLNIKTGDVVANYNCEFGHCNSMCFNAKNNKVYVVPNQMYVSGAAVKSNQMFICNQYTLSIEETIQLPNIGLNAAFDFVTEKMYVTCETTYNGAYAVEMYEYDYVGNTFTSLGIIPYSPKAIEKFNGRSIGTDGAQGAIVYDGNAYFLIGGHVNALVNFDISTMRPIGIININPNCFIYTLSEGQSASFTPNGNIILNGTARNACNVVVMLISALSYAGLTFNSFDNYAPRNTYYQYVDCNGSLDANWNIYQTGAEGNKFALMGDAISLAIMQGLPIKVLNTCKLVGIPRTDLSPNTIRFVAGNDAATLEIAQNLYFNSPVYFDGISATRRLTIKSGYEEQKDTLFTSYKFTSFRYVNFDCANMRNYIAKCNGFIIVDDCVANNVEGMYTTIIDAQNRGNGFIVGSTGVSFHNPAPLQV